MKNLIFFLSFCCLIIFGNCSTENKTPTTSAKNDLTFKTMTIADSVKLMWAHCPADITGDGISDLVFIHNNANGGTLGFFEGTTSTETWERKLIAAKAPKGGTFAIGDLECVDMDFDGDKDIVVAEHPGEWDKSDTTAVLYWLENPSWKAHQIGTTPTFIKDISISDFDKNKRMDVVALTFEKNTLSIFQQKSSSDWERVQYLEGFGNLHEGMSSGDVNGDGWTDVVANAYVFFNPKGNLTQEWKIQNIDKQWNSQTGDWSKNGTKAFLKDINADGKEEIFISHSERSGYPLVWYQMNEDGSWEKNIISDSIPACHTLQVFDFDLDGDFDVLAGVNKSRSINLGIENAEVTIFLSDQNYQSWTPKTLQEQSIYNGQANDFDLDGDMDIFRYSAHDATDFQLLINQVY